MSNELKYRSALDNSNDLKLYKNCFDRNNSIKKIEKIEWLLFGKKYIWVEFAIEEIETEKVVGIIATLPLRTKYFDTSIISCQYLDTMTDENHRGKGLFVKLANQSYKNVSKHGCKFGWGFPNKNAAHGWFKKLNWTEIDNMPFIIKPLKTKFITDKLNEKITKFIPNLPLSFAKKIKLRPDTSLLKITNFDNRFDVLWNEFSSEINISVVRDSTYLQWRYILKPSEDYQSFVIVDDATNKILAYITYCVKEKHGGKIGYIMELMYTPNCEFESSEILKFATNQILLLKGDVILAWCFSHSSNYKSFSKNFFWQLPKRFQFIKMYFGAIAFDNNIKEKLMQNRNWYISYSDSDTV